ncbi:uncharacterized protein LOC132262503 [Phlebotomus argentipes]|uniref:uncharacterized protein LOC132262503 n=1 Tax=Phlebotomus argentipes TaxID=94469 RepID=UPI002892CF1E|nr:uncharacterized protein LOC132262503 [Phlebotomus argentipes]
MTLKRVVIFTSLAALLFGSAATLSLYDLVVKRIQCTELIENYIDNSCTVNLKNRSTTYIQINVTPHYDLVDPIIRITFYKRFVVYRKFLIDVREDFCGLIKEGKPAPVISIIWKTLNKGSNLAEGCPMVKVKLLHLNIPMYLWLNDAYFPQDTLYYVKDYVFDVSHFPPGLPTGDYRIDIEMNNSADGKDFIKIEIFIVLTRKPASDIEWS